MCGRYVEELPVAEVAEAFSARFDPELLEEVRPSWNIAPTRNVLGVSIGRERFGDPEGERILSRYRWGFVPPWAKDLSVGARTFNARAETVASRPMFRHAFKMKRIIVPASPGFYEWSKSPAEPKQPYLLSRTDGAPMALAGLWEGWRDPARGEDPTAWIRSCTIITTEAGPDLGEVHDRQPVVLEAADWQLWLDPSVSDAEALARLLEPSPAGTLVRRRIGREVGRTSNDSPDLLLPLAEEA